MAHIYGLIMAYIYGLIMAYIWLNYGLYMGLSENRVP